MAEFLNGLRHEHVNTIALLDLLDEQVSLFEKGESPDYDAVDLILRYTYEYAERYHHPKEDLVYRYLCKRHPDMDSAVHNLEDDHVRLEAETKEFADIMRQIADGAEVSRPSVIEKARRYSASMRRHLEMEETWIFPDADKYLTIEDWVAIEAEAVGADDPLIGEGPTELSRRLNEEIAGHKR